MSDVAIRVERAADVEAFAARVRPFLLEHESENCVALGVLGGARKPGDQLYLAAAYWGERIVGVAVMPADGPLLLATGTTEGAVVPMAEDLLSSGPTVAIAIAAPVVAAAFARSVTALTGSDAALAARERAHRLTAVRSASRPAGALRRAGSTDRALLVDWIAAFVQETFGEDDRPAVERFVDGYLAGVSSQRDLFLWEHAGEPVSMSGASGPTPNGIRVNFVYTPPELRGRGFASAAVATLSQALLDAGNRSCFLLTDLANPTSNRIYAAIGYEPRGDLERWAFARP